MNMSKKWKRAFFRHIFANNFCMVHFSKLFQWIQNQRETLRFFDTHIEFLNKKFFLLLLALFVYFDCEMRRKRLKKTENLFYECVLEFY